MIRKLLLSVALALLLTPMTLAKDEATVTVPHFIPSETHEEAPRIYPRYRYYGPPAYPYYDYYGRPYIPRPRPVPPKDGWGHRSPAPGYGRGQGPLYRYWYTPHDWGFSIGPRWWQ